MFRSVVLAFLYGTALVLGGPLNTTITPRTCGVVLTPERKAAAEQHFQDHLKLTSANIASRSSTKATTPNIFLDLYFHVISEDLTPAGGNLDDSQITSVISSMNTAFAKLGITWLLKGTTRTVNAEWFNKVRPATAEDTAMRLALRQGGVADLNVYTVNLPSLLGYSTMPSDYGIAPQEDGIVVHFSTFPGGTVKAAEGTITHEAGHWVGLYHTYEHGCTGDGDFVADTAAEASPSWGCPTKGNLCPNVDIVDGVQDPIHNFMDGTDDTCMLEFTAGQADRVKGQMATYRGTRF